MMKSVKLLTIVRCLIILLLLCAAAFLLYELMTPSLEETGKFVGATLV